MTSSADRNQIQPASSRCCWTVESEGNGTIRLLFEGDWKLDQTLPKPAEILASDAPEGTLRKVRFDSRSLAGWDSGLLVFLRDLDRIAEKRRIEIDRAGLPEGVRKLLDLAAAVPERKGARRWVERDPFLDRVAAGIRDKPQISQPQDHHLKILLPIPDPGRGPWVHCSGRRLLGGDRS